MKELASRAAQRLESAPYCLPNEINTMKNKALIALMALLPVACGGSDTPAAPALDAAAVAAGKAVFAEKGCTGCHGETGLGDGAAAAALDPKPRNYTDAKWQSETTDEQIKASITEGTKRADGTPTSMIAYGALLKGEELNNLVTYIRSLKK